MGIVVQLPPTPQKQPLANLGISSQILPLSRLSLSSGGGISPTSSQASSSEVGENNNKVNSSSSSSGDSPPTEDGEFKQWPVKDKFLRLRRSFTEPLVQYFQELQMTPSENEEPEVLNTPKSVAASQHRESPPAHSTPKSAEDGSRSKRSRNILPALQSHAEEEEEEEEQKDEGGGDKDGETFPGELSERKYENIPPIIVTDM
jgi:hypothetical protein